MGNTLAKPVVDLPSPPFIDVPGLRNFRDCGLYPITDDVLRPLSTTTKIIRPGILYRSSEPSKITSQGIAILHKLQISTIYDLRSQTEITKDIARGRGVREIPGTRRIFAPVFRETDYGPEEIAKRVAGYTSSSSDGFVKVYDRMLESGSCAERDVAPYRMILRHLASSEAPEPFLLHCSAGKDRTGVICAVVLSLCGVSDEVVAHEYALTDLGLMERKEEFVAHLLAGPDFKGNRAAAYRMVSSRKENMIGTLEMIREKYGGVEDFVRVRCGLPDEDIARLRHNMVIELDNSQEPIKWETHAMLMKRHNEAMDGPWWWRIWTRLWLWRW